MVLKAVFVPQIEQLFSKVTLPVLKEFQTFPDQNFLRKLNSWYVQVNGRLHSCCTIFYLYIFFFHWTALHAYNAQQIGLVKSFHFKMVLIATFSRNVDILYKNFCKKRLYLLLRKVRTFYERKVFISCKYIGMKFTISFAMALLNIHLLKVNIILC